MLFAQMLAEVEKRLSEERRLDDAKNARDETSAVWTRGSEEAALHPSTSTGVLLRLVSRGRVIHEKIFAASEISVARIARAITEHLTGYTA